MTALASPLTTSRSSARRDRPSMLVARCAPAQRDDAWDSFVADAPGGTIEQSTAWAATKQRLGLDVALVTLSRGDRLVGGAVVQTKTIAPGVRVGYVPHGPVLGPDERERFDEMVGALVDAGRTLRLRALVIQPSHGRPGEPQVLDARGFIASPLAVATDATVAIDLTQPVQRLTSALSSSRRHVRKLAESPLRIREAREDVDVDAFYRLYVASAQRQGFVPVSHGYVRAQWEVLNPSGQLRLFVAELDGVAVAAQVATFFGDTVTPRLKGWTGEDRSRAPELLDWWLIQLAKAEAYRRFDQGGVNRAYALGVLSGERSAVAAMKAAHPTSYYKHSFGGTIELLAPPHLLVYNPIARTVARALGPRFANAPRLRRLANRWKSG